MPFFSDALCYQLAKQGLRIFNNTNVIVNFIYRGPVLLAQNSTFIRSKIDAFSYLGSYSSCTTSNIGRYCSIGEYVRIGMGMHDINEVSTSTVFNQSSIFKFAGYTTDRLSTLRQERHGENTCNVNIGHDVWIGSNVLFPDDINIGHGAVIGANAIITKDIPPYAVVVGNNRIVKYRFSDEIISDFLELNWWNYNIPDMIKSGVEVSMDNPKEFIARFKELDPSKLISFDNKSFYFVEIPSTEQTIKSIQLKPISDNSLPYFDIHQHKQQ